MSTVSVIIPVYNNIKTLEATLDSIVNQTHRPLELIIVDDCSNDGSYAFAKAYSQKNQSNSLTCITLQNATNSGAGITRQNALDLATGRFIAFLDADDVWKPEKLNKQLNAMQSTKASVCYSAYELFIESPEDPHALQEIPSFLDYKKLLKANYIGNLTGIYDASVIGKIPISALRKRQDWAMWLDALKISKTALGIEEPLAYYRIGSGLSGNKWKLITYNYAVYKTHLGFNTFKSMGYLIRFFYEQFAIKKKLFKPYR